MSKQDITTKSDAAPTDKYARSYMSNVTLGLIGKNETALKAISNQLTAIERSKIPGQNDKIHSLELRLQDCTSDVTELKRFISEQFDMIKMKDNVGTRQEKEWSQQFRDLQTQNHTAKQEILQR